MINNSDKDTVVLLGPSAERYKGGVAQFTSRLADEISKSADCHFYSWQQMYPNFLIKRDFADKVSQMKVGKQQADFLLEYMSPKTWREFTKQLKSMQPEYVVFTWVHPVHAPVYKYLAKRIKKYTAAELIYICHNVLPHEYFRGAWTLSKMGLSWADRLVVHGESEERVAHSIFPDKPVTKLYHPIFDIFTPSKEARMWVPTEDKLKLLFFGNIRHYKGLDILLQALPILRRRKIRVHLTIAGEAFDEQTFKEAEELVNSLGLHDIITADIRYIPNEEISGYFDNADVAVFPYRSATQSGVIAAAFAHGVPVITTNVGSLSDAVRHGENGYVVVPENPGALADMIERFHRHPIRRDVVQDYARLMSWSRYVKELIKD